MSTTLLLTAAVILGALIATAPKCVGVRIDGNNSISVLNWTDNHLPDQMRTYGNGYYFTQEEEVALDKFRPLVAHLAPHPFLRRDNFLIKFLRARNLDVDAASEMYKAAMEWRIKRHVDEIVVKDYGPLEKLAPFIVSGLDKQNGPIFYIVTAAYDIRKAVVAGHYQTLEELFDRAFEIATRAGVHIFETTGQNAGLAATLIVDLSRFTLRQHACTQCLPLYEHFRNTYEEYWPQAIRKIYCINTPRAFDSVLQIMRPALPIHTAAAYEVYGSDKEEWGPVLLKDIDPGQLLVRYGGTRKLNSFSSLNFMG